jgi:spore germination protein
MLGKFVTVAAGIVAGMFCGYFLIANPTNLPIGQIAKNNGTDTPRKQVVIGFLPFWLLDKASNDYTSYITQLSYFNVTIDSDGSVQKFTSPGESDPGYRSLTTGKVDRFLNDQKSKGIDLSLTVFSGDDKKINAFLENPVKSADNLYNDLAPLIEKYGFKDINLDIEKVADASIEQRKRYADFVRQFRKNLNSDITITLDVVASSFVKQTNLCDPAELSEIVDYIVLMGYDFHNPSSSVTGPVAPQSGAGSVSEFDIESAVQAAKAQMPANKLVLAIPLYGYSWESIGNYPRAAVMPGSAYSISSRSVRELLLNECKNCIPIYEETDKENYIIYENSETGLFQQVFYPDIKSTKVKVDFAIAQGLGGVALWALGYEDPEILEPLKAVTGKN